jgi:hypothetical protein
MDHLLTERMAHNDALESEMFAIVMNENAPDLRWSNRLWTSRSEVQAAIRSNPLTTPISTLPIDTISTAITSLRDGTPPFNPPNPPSNPIPLSSVSPSDLDAMRSLLVPRQDDHHRTEQSIQALNSLDGRLRQVEQQLACSPTSDELLDIRLEITKISEALGRVTRKHQPVVEKKLEIQKRLEAVYQICEGLLLPLADVSTEPLHWNAGMYSLLYCYLI